MLTIDLEKELISENTELISRKEALIIKEVDNLLSTATDEDISYLNKYGLMNNVSEKQKIDKTVEQYKKLRDIFGDKLFTEDQIKITAHKYALKFLPSELYKGTVDPVLPLKLKEWHNDYPEYSGNDAYILAPGGQFNLVEKPKDPLFFISVGDGYYVLIHKWGNDLSIFRRIRGFFPLTIWGVIKFYLLCIHLPVLYIITQNNENFITTGDYMILGFLYSLIITLVTFMVGAIYYMISVTFEHDITDYVYSPEEWKSSNK